LNSGANLQHLKSGARRRKKPKPISISRVSVKQVTSGEDAEDQYCHAVKKEGREKNRAKVQMRQESVSSNRRGSHRRRATASIVCPCFDCARRIGEKRTGTNIARYLELDSCPLKRLSIVIKTKGQKKGRKSGNSSLCRATRKKRRGAKYRPLARIHS